MSAQEPGRRANTPHSALAPGRDHKFPARHKAQLQDDRTFHHALLALTSVSGAVQVRPKKEAASAGELFGLVAVLLPEALCLPHAASEPGAQVRPKARPRMEDKLFWLAALLLLEALDSIAAFSAGGVLWSTASLKHTI